MGRGAGRGGASEDERYQTYGILGCCCGIASLLILILVPLSFVKLQYYEHGLLTQRSTSTVNRKKVYGPGSHQVGPDYEFKVFQTSLLSFDNTMDVWTKSGGTDAGVTINIDVSFQYLLRPKYLGEIYDMVALNYENNIKSVAIDSLKNTAPLFGADDYLTNRPKIEMAFAQNVSSAIGAFYCDVVSLQMRRVAFEDEYYDTKTAAAVQIETNEKEEYVQTASLVRTLTDVEAEAIENDALEVSEAASATAELMVATAEYEALETIENARNLGLKALYDSLNIETEAQKASLDYLLLLSSKAASSDTALNAYIDFSSANSFS